MSLSGRSLKNSRKSKSLRIESQVCTDEQLYDNTRCERPSQKNDILVSILADTTVVKCPKQALVGVY